MFQVRSSISTAGRFDAMRRGIFITGTDTGVGKTYIAAGIAAALKQQGINIGVMKPAETGCSLKHGKLVPRDALRLIKAADVRDPLALVNPYRYREPIAPHLAAIRAGSIIKPTSIMNAFRTVSQNHDFMIVEGAGGIMVPLSGKYLYLDLARRMNLPVIIVARPGLGTINHTLLTISALKAKSVPILGIVINFAQDSKRGLAERTGPAAIEEITRERILATISHNARDFGQLANKIIDQD